MLRRLKYAPTNLIIDQTVLCNQECVFCWRSDRDKVRKATEAAPHLTMPMDLFREIVDQGAAHGLRDMSLCGPMGEPTLVPDLVDRGLYAKSKGFSVLINTNGVALHKHEDLHKAVDFIMVSLDAHEPELYAEMHGKPHHAQVLQNIQDLDARAKHGQVRVRFTVTEKNRDQLAAVVAQDWKVNVYVKDVHSFIDVVDVDGDPGRCNQPEGSVNYTYTGLMTTCCINYKMAPTFGHISEGLKECWEGEAFEAWRADRLYGLCQGCSGLSRQVQRRTRSQCQR